MSGVSGGERLDIRTWAACGFGLGFSPLAPGTLGTLGIAFVWGMAGSLPPLLDSLLVVILAGIGFWLCGHAERRMGHDAGAIVWDEFAGFALAMWMLPHTWMGVGISFVLFRLFDITKPYPANVSQRLPGGWGVVTDDLIAGVYANAAARLIGLLLP